ncbi:hypothetical protein D3C71_1640260 [compost metagenome]
MRVFCFSVRKIAAVKLARLLNKSHLVPISNVRASSGLSALTISVVPSALSLLSPSASTPTGFAEVAKLA